MWLQGYVRISNSSGVSKEEADLALGKLVNRPVYLAVKRSAPSAAMPCTMSGMYSDPLNIDKYTVTAVHRGPGAVVRGSLDKLHP